MSIKTTTKLNQESRKKELSNLSRNQEKKLLKKKKLLKYSNSITYCTYAHFFCLWVKDLWVNYNQLYDKVNTRN